MAKKHRGKMSGTRRDFLRRVAQAGGYRATYLTMQAMGLLGTAAVAEPLALEPGALHGTKLVALRSVKRAGLKRQRLSDGGRAQEAHRLHGEVGGAIASSLRDPTQEVPTGAAHLTPVLFCHPLIPET